MSVGEESGGCSGLSRGSELLRSPLLGLPDEEADYLGVRIQLRRERVGVGAAGFLEWWVIELKDCQAQCNLLPMVIFSDKVSPPSLGFLAGYG